MKILHHYIWNLKKKKAFEINLWSKISFSNMYFFQIFNQIDSQKRENMFLLPNFLKKNSPSNYYLWCFTRTKHYISSMCFVCLELFIVILFTCPLRMIITKGIWIKRGFELFYYLLVFKFIIEMFVVPKNNMNIKG